MGNDRPRRRRNSFSAMPADLPDARPLQSATVPQRDATLDNLISHLVADRLVVIAGTRNAAIGRSLKAAGAREQFSISASTPKQQLLKIFIPVPYGVRPTSAATIARSRCLPDIAL